MRKRSSGVSLTIWWRPVGDAESEVLIDEGGNLLFHMPLIVVV